MTISGIAAMRIHVRMFGTVQSIWRFSTIGGLSSVPECSGARVQMIINVSRERRTDTRDFLDVGDPGSHDLLQAAEVLEQGAAPGRAEPRHRFQHRLVVAARAL